MKVMVTFDRVGDILDELQRQRVDAAEICLVGWNQKGHDGRWPQIFPVEEALGGEDKLREVIKKAQRMGYQIVGHANHIDAYLIADCWDAEYVRKNHDGTLPRGKTTWGGGRVYTICAQRAYGRFAVKDTPMIAALGFRGLHYLDVFTCVPPAPCGDPRHPLDERRTALFIDRIMRLGKDAFGGIASEGPYDFCCGNLDSVLYVSFDKPHQPMPKMVDRFVPIWQLVYNGIILSSPFTTTVNYTAQDRLSQLKLIEFNGRPVFYFYSRFKNDGKNWMGEGDLGCANAAELRDSVAKIKQGCNEFHRLSPLQLEFMEQHEQLAPGVFRTAFSDGSEIITNYGSAGGMSTNPERLGRWITCCSAGRKRSGELRAGTARASRSRTGRRDQSVAWNPATLMKRPLDWSDFSARTLSWIVCSPGASPPRDQSNGGPRPGPY